ncbi:hypothetical protein [Sporisorium scitamineum]|uniref:ribonuclease H n=1 Tax=Sporisorium scitamineum TaxID=49012 RepID=A0A0F7RRN1_9BASI|nr:hypothetical protein [Sporisorium scitamineum]
MTSFDHRYIESITHRDYVFVYCDGAAIHNGASYAQAGFAVYFPDPELDWLNESGSLPDYEQTSNRAELYALIRAAEAAPTDGRQVVIFSDSKYAINCAHVGHVGNEIADQMARDACYD